MFLIRVNQTHPWLKVLKCLSIGTLETTTFPFVPNGKLWLLGVPIFKHIIIRLYCARILGHLKIINFPFGTNGKFIIFRCPLCQITSHRMFTLLVPETKIADFANSIDLDEVAQNEPPHLDLYYLPSSL